MAHRRSQRSDGRRSRVLDERADDTCSKFYRRTYLRSGAAAITALLGGVGLSMSNAAASPDRRDSGVERRLTISGDGTTSKYEFTVDGSLSPGVGASEDGGGQISGTSAEGIVTQEDRRYRFSGELRDIAIDGDAEVYVESTRIDPAEW